MSVQGPMQNQFPAPVLSPIGLSEFSVDEKRSAAFAVTGGRLEEQKSSRGRCKTTFSSNSTLTFKL